MNTRVVICIVLVLNTFRSLLKIIKYHFKGMSIRVTVHVSLILITFFFSTMSKILKKYKIFKKQKISTFKKKTIFQQNYMIIDSPSRVEICKSKVGPCQVQFPKIQNCPWSFQNKFPNIFSNNYPNRFLNYVILISYSEWEYLRVRSILVGLKKTKKYIFFL